MFFQLFKVIWFSAAASFMLVSIGAGILQCFRRDKEWWDLPRFVLAPLMILWLVGAVSGDRYRNSWRSRTDCGLARASFRLVENERRPAEILKDEARRIAVNIARLRELLQKT